jgi:hypothetical protein
MSRSVRKTPIRSITTCRSERWDKKTWHSRWRSRERIALHMLSPAEMDSHLASVENEVSNVWLMGKDGHCYWSPAEQVQSAEYFANTRGRSPQERAALKKRLLRKWAAK